MKTPSATQAPVDPATLLQEDCPDLVGAYRAKNPFSEYLRSNLNVSFGELPEGSCYKPAYPTKAGDYDLRVYPKIEGNDLVGDYGLEISVRAVLQAQDESLPISCSKPVGHDLRDEVFMNGPYKVTVSSSIDYIYDGDAPYSNPNPYSPELVDTILKVFRGIRIGKCE